MREIVIGVAAVSGLGTAGYVSGAFEGGEYYEMAPADVSAKLAGMTLPEEMQDTTGFLSMRTAAAGPQQVKWDIVSGGYSIAEIDAFLEPSGSGTRVSVEFAMLDGPEKEQIAKVMPLDDEFMGDVIEMALTEQIDATLEDRPFDQRKLALMMTGYVAANPGKIANFQQSVQQNLDKQLEEVDEAGFYDDVIDEHTYDTGSFDEAADDWGQ